jgi:hypothetical protein
MATIRVMRSEATPLTIQVWALYDGAYHEVFVDRATYDGLDAAGKRALVGGIIYEAEQARLAARYGNMIGTYTYTPPPQGGLDATG